MRGWLIGVGLVGWIVAQRYAAFRPSVSVLPLTTTELPRLQEPKPVLPVIRLSPELQAVYDQFLQNQRHRLTVAGYRIQVLATPEKSLADSVRFQLIESYPDLPVHVFYEAPLYRVRVGDFIEKAEASQWLERLREVFRGAFIVPDQIYKP